MMFYRIVARVFTIYYLRNCTSSHSFIHSFIQILLYSCVHLFMCVCVFNRPFFSRKSSSYKKLGCRSLRRERCGDSRRSRFRGRKLNRSTFHLFRHRFRRFLSDVFVVVVPFRFFASEKHSRHRSVRQVIHQRLDQNVRGKHRVRFRRVRRKKIHVLVHHQ